MNRIEKVKSLTDSLQMAKNALKKDPIIAVGGMTYHNSPMALLRALSRDRDHVSGLTCVAGPMTALPVDYLCAAGMLERCMAAYIGFEELGLAPNFRTAVQDGRVEVWECDETMIVAGLEAAARGLPCGITRAGIGTDLLKVNPNVKEFAEPLSGEKVVAVPPLKPALTLLHVQKADPFGNCINEGPIFLDRLMAQAAKRYGGMVIVSTEELQDNESIISNPQAVSLPSVLVDTVVEIPWGAHPCSSNGRYSNDADHIAEYFKMTKEGFQAYFQKYVLDIQTPADYVTKIGVQHLEHLRLKGGHLEHLRLKGG